MDIQVLNWIKILKHLYRDNISLSNNQKRGTIGVPFLILYMQNKIFAYSIILYTHFRNDAISITKR